MIFSTFNQIPSSADSKSDLVLLLSGYAVFKFKLYRKLVNNAVKATFI